MEVFGFLNCDWCFDKGYLSILDASWIRLENAPHHIGTHKEILDSCFNWVADLFDVKMASTKPWKFQTRAEYHFFPHALTSRWVTQIEYQELHRRESVQHTAVHCWANQSTTESSKMHGAARDRRLITCVWSANITSRLCLTSFSIGGQMLA